MTRGFAAVEAKLDEPRRRHPARQGADRRRLDAGLDRRRRQRPAVGHRPCAGPAGRSATPSRSSRRELVDALDAAVAGGRRAGRGRARRQDDGRRAAAGGRRAAQRRSTRARRSATALAAAARGRRGGHARDGADAGPQGPGVVPRRALDRPPGSGRDVGGPDRGRARARGLSDGPMSELARPRHPASPGAALGRAWTHAGAAAGRARPARAEEECARGRARPAAGGRTSWPALAAALRADGPRRRRRDRRDQPADGRRTRRWSTPRWRRPQSGLRRRRGDRRGGRAARARRWPGWTIPMLAARAADLRAIARRAGELAPGGGSRAAGRARSWWPRTSAPARSRPGRRIVAGDRAGRGRHHRPRRDRRALAGDPAGDRRAGEPAAGDRRRRADRRSTPTAAWCCAAIDADTRDRLRAADRPARRRRPSATARERLEPAVTCDGRGCAAAGERRHGGGGRGRARGRRRGHRPAAQRARVPRCSRLAAARRSTPRRSRRCSRLLADRIATVRTLDFGGDKTPPFLLATGADEPARAARHPAGAGGRGRRRRRSCGRCCGCRATPCCGS